MKSNTSILNPYAESYVPLFKREIINDDKDLTELSVEAARSDAQDDSKLKGHQGDASDGASSENCHHSDCKIMDEESEMDLAYLQMVFPGVSEQSLADVYHVNQGDLDAALDMLSHLESADSLPDALEMEKQEEPISSGECSSAKAIKVTNESSSSSQPSDSTAAT